MRLFVVALPCHATPVAVGQNICAPSCAVRSYCIERTPHDQNEALLYGCV
jgi:hypothetical protein